MNGRSANFTVFAFDSTRIAVAAEAALKDAELPAVTIPMPSALSDECGVAVRVPTKDADAARRALESAGLRSSASITIEDVEPSV